MKKKDKKPTTTVKQSNEEDNFTLDWWEIPPDIRPHLPSIEEPENPEMFENKGPIPDEKNPFSPKHKVKEAKVPPNRLFDKY